MHQLFDVVVGVLVVGAVISIIATIKMALRRQMEIDKMTSFVAEDPDLDQVCQQEYAASKRNE